MGGPKVPTRYFPKSAVTGRVSGSRAILANQHLDTTLRDIYECVGAVDRLGVLLNRMSHCCRNERLAISDVQQPGGADLLDIIGIDGDHFTRL